MNRQLPVSLFSFSRGRLVAAACAVTFAAITIACGGGKASDPAAAAPAGAMAMPVEAVTVAERPVEQVGEFVGTVRSRRSTTIQPQAEGFITSILVTSGARVAPGAPLFEIDATSQQAGLASLESVRVAREADATFARQQADRVKALLAAGAASQQEFEAATTQQKAAEAQLKAIDEQLRQQRNDLSYFKVTAPTAGVVGDIPVRVGDRVTRATMLTTVEDNSGLELYIGVPVQDAPQLKVGLPVRILNERGDVVATEHVSFISPSVDAGTQTVLVKTPLGAGTFRTDQFVRVNVVLNTAPGVMVPVVSVLRINGQYFAYVAEGGRGGLVAHQRALTLGRVIGNDYIVLAGLKAGDQLITSGIQKIGDGAPVQLMPKAAAPAPGAGGK